MITTSFDPQAGTLYCYFTELLAGSTTGEAECAATLLLDGEGQLIGVELELDESITPDDLALALAHPQATYNRHDYTLTLHMLDEQPAEAQPLHEPAILDFDDDGRLQGCELLAAPEFGLAERLARLAPFMVDLDEEEQKIEDRGSTSEDRASGVDPRSSEDFRTGFVALVGRPNVGKS